MTDSTVLVTTQGPVTKILLNRPDKLNALSQPLMRSLLQALQQADVDTDCRCVLLSGSGRGFSAGADLTGFGLQQNQQDGPDIGAALHSSYHPVIRLMRNMHKPVITAINGIAAGAGCNIGLAGDIVIASQTATFIQSFINIGLIPDAAGTWTIPRLIGRARALQWMMSGEPLKADTALNWGLISAVYADDDLMQQAETLAQRMAAQPTKALAAIKTLVDKSIDQDIEAQMHSEAVAQSQLGRSADCVEGITAFLERRTPAFGGQ